MSESGTPVSPGREPSAGARLVAVGSDERTASTDAAVAHLGARGLDVLVAGPLAGRSADWVQVAREVGRAVAEGRAERAVLFCYTGTGASIAVNKVPGVRGALCVDAETARGARRWNDANVLVLSYRLATETLVREIIDAFLDTPADPAQAATIDQLRELERAARDAEGSSPG
ncbi:RpiB/LacA/LacB family sugar-phosphate isomerase [Actinocrinis puniceicyclus]|uniref:RpiB/LacA/LacB family sugar-phosphate isomerase n=1 Tax=Actinocrinis puniceicyclus TaxID=977794 RepID=A0A8J7WRJ1_9ACTN|nr:RpiB/LacA/LacB family sugar-phosphate isomerase [Actinocrinis puniceicyclus]MBS2964069.1 RpiB/LacA/LacB family sugar-phosphate isomerase [Actinocrinis puniceicyclus]